MDSKQQKSWRKSRLVYLLKSWLKKIRQPKVSQKETEDFGKEIHRLAVYILILCDFHLDLDQTHGQDQVVIVVFLGVGSCLNLYGTFVVLGA